MEIPSCLTQDIEFIGKKVATLSQPSTSVGAKKNSVTVKSKNPDQR